MQPDSLARRLTNLLQHPYRGLTTRSLSCALLKPVIPALPAKLNEKNEHKKATMRNQDLLAIAVVALGTATLTVMTFWAGPIEAGGDQDANAAKFAKPKLVCRGVELTLAAKDGAVLKAGDKPVLELIALNTEAQSAEVSVCVTMSAMAPADPLSRTPRMPSTIWRCDQSLALKANETRAFTLTTDAALPTNSIISFSLHEVNGNAPTPSATVRTSPSPALTWQPGVVVMSVSTAIAQPARKARG